MLLHRHGVGLPGDRTFKGIVQHALQVANLETGALLSGSRRAASDADTTQPDATETDNPDGAELEEGDGE